MHRPTKLPPPPGRYRLQRFLRIVGDICFIVLLLTFAMALIALGVTIASELLVRYVQP